MWVLVELEKYDINFLSVKDLKLKLNVSEMTQENTQMLPGNLKELIFTTKINFNIYSSI